MTNVEITFAKLGLNNYLLKALNKIGYIKPSPIQKECIPPLLLKKDVLGIAQTGSGKTAAFSLPLLQNINISNKNTQILILTPTRELAMQVSKAISLFSKFMIGVNVLVLYGGQSYSIQFKGLRLGPQIIVATPGRLLDHIKRGTVNLLNLKSLVLDEADEMLRMGFIEDVEHIISIIPKGYQIALFSATMPIQIKNITKRFMNNPHEVRIASNINTIPNINQSYWTSFGRKVDALKKFLEAEEFDAVLIFVRTKHATNEISEILKQSGYNSAALNGDMNQNVREQTLERFKNGSLDILIATDIAARGLDVERISLVINYDIPIDVESYVHRIGRTGRAGRTGKALMFVENREKRFLRNIERKIKLHIPEVFLPNSKLLTEKRLIKFSIKINKELKSKDLEKYKVILNKLQYQNNLDSELLSIALLKIAQGHKPLILPPDPIFIPKKTFYKKSRFIKLNSKLKNKNINNYYKKNYKNKDMELYSINIGKKDGVEIRHIVGAIINEGEINSHYIGNIKLFPLYSTIELSKIIKKNILKNFKKIRILNKIINIKSFNS
ncbi:DEAD/DEAH box helicase [Enterobacteriaceae endosymbiont of Plateumaris pusilla]|uniref:DEAD/DEAH box helicase n=1 Tax=Enterobacteriaceae endosymbiont of Plateumaris pusilla TaxID=2675795 RepID=UPI001449E835|nr:DEAD/DEAH box helicase [Enterobacteriaceae endosymbiont of Plateumaris pusilla]QJC29603.1 DEAD/DEAH box helicase [Enterobacteriaceae endosymbiont of Plateumaris pusilla]